MVRVSLFQRKHQKDKMGNSSNKQQTPELIVPSIYDDVDKMRHLFSVEECEIVNHLEAYRKAGERDPRKKYLYEKYSDTILDDIADIKCTLHEVVSVKKTFGLRPDHNAAHLFHLQEKLDKQYLRLRVELFQYFSIVTLKSKFDDEESDDEESE